MDHTLLSVLSTMVRVGVRVSVMVMFMVMVRVRFRASIKVKVSIEVKVSNKVKVSIKVDLRAEVTGQQQLEVRCEWCECFGFVQAERGVEPKVQARLLGVQHDGSRLRVRWVS